MFDNRRLEIVKESTIDSIIEPGTKVTLRIKADKINIFDTNGQTNLVKGVLNDLIKGGNDVS
jgi:iron(III) transport system ATP-binding protein